MGVLIQFHAWTWEKFTRHVYFEQYFTRHKFKRENFKSHFTLLSVKLTRHRLIVGFITRDV